MKTTKDSICIVSLLVIIISAVAYLSALSNPNGISGRTRKTTSAGCSSCHNFGTGITGTIEGPDSVETGHSAVFTLTLFFPGTANGGLDIAAKRGTLSAGTSSSIIKLLNGELTHKNPVVFTTSVSIDFNYNAPSTGGTDTLYATIDRNYPGAWNYTDNFGIKIYNSISITPSETPVSFRLLQNYPNPFNSVTQLVFSVIRKGFVEIKILDIKGNTVAVPVKGYMEAGDYSRHFDASFLPSGIYFCRMEFNDGKDYTISEIRKLSLVK